MGNVIYVNKPSGMSSFDVCYKLRKVFNTKRIGHTGTLDPNANGVMIILVNEATKASQFLVSDTKQYRTRVLFGIETDTLDIDGKIIRKEDYLLPNEEEIESILNSFLGESKQEVPLTSAKKIDGKKLYQYQLEGKEVKLPIIDINVSEIELNEIHDDGFTFTCNVSSGTYIRSLVRDILSKLEIIGTVSELTRTKIDDISLDECDNLNDVINGKYTNHSLFDVLSKRYKIYEIEDVEHIKNGKPLKINDEEEYILIASNSNAIAMYRKDNNLYRSARGLW